MGSNRRSDDRVRAALAHGHVIDITTIGRRSGQPRRIEIVFHAIDGRVFISGMPNEARQRSWLANLDANPRFTFHLKDPVQADLEATARVISDEAERRSVLRDVQRAWPSQDLEAMVRWSPLVEVTFADFVATHEDGAPLQSRLTPIQYAVTQEAATEPPFSGVYWDHHGDGTYRCVVCRTALFDSSRKFESGSGWPSFWDAAEQGRVTTHDDRSHGTVRTEARCGTCGAHLGHLFPDGPGPTGMRYCINSASLEFDPRSAA
jgi:peptide-methionine (R)-S-oxide reductase